MIDWLRLTRGFSPTPGRAAPFFDVIGETRYPREPPRSCDLCGQTNEPRAFQGRFGMRVSIAECHCGLVYQSPRPSEDASAAYMNWRWASSDPYVNDTKKKRDKAKAKVALVKKFHPEARSILDFGAGSGVFVHECVEAGLAASGIEQSLSAVAKARSFYNVDLQTHISTSGSYDVVTLWDVVEHLRDPVDLLRTIKDLINPGGSIILETGNYNNWRRIHEGDAWGLFLLDHQYYFTPETLSRILQKSGYKNVQLLDMNHRRVKQPSSSDKSDQDAYRHYIESMRRWPDSGDINIMVMSAEA